MSSIMKGIINEAEAFDYDSLAATPAKERIAYLRDKPELRNLYNAEWQKRIDAELNNYSWMTPEEKARYEKLAAADDTSLGTQSKSFSAEKYLKQLFQQKMDAKKAASMLKVHWAPLADLQKYLTGQVSTKTELSAYLAKSPEDLGKVRWGSGTIGIVIDGHITIGGRGDLGSDQYKTVDGARGQQKYASRPGQIDPTFDTLDLGKHHEVLVDNWKIREIVLPSDIPENVDAVIKKAGIPVRRLANQAQPVNEEQLDENLRKWFKEKWVRFGPDGKIRGACARGDDSEGKPKCLPQKKAQNLGKKGRKYAASKKRREDPNPERTGKAKNVATKKTTNEDVPFNQCPKCRGPIVHESMMNEKQDACYHKVKSRYKVWPSAYASGALVQCRKKGASNWGKKTESSIMKGIIGEGESVSVIYINDKPATKYANKFEAESDAKRLRDKFPDKNIEVRSEVRGGIGGNEKLGEAGNPAQQAAIAISKKKASVDEANEPNRISRLSKWDNYVDSIKAEIEPLEKKMVAAKKSGDMRTTSELAKKIKSLRDKIDQGTINEAKAKPYVKPYNDPQTGEQIGWVSSDGYHKKYWQKFAKDSAIKHAKLNPDEVQEDYTGEFAAEKTPTVNPHAGIKDRQFRGAIGEAGGAKYIVRSRDGVERAYSNPNSIGATNWKNSYQKKSDPFKALKPQKPTLDQIWQKVEHAISNYFPDGDPSDFLNPYLERNNLQWDDITRAAKKHGYKSLWHYWDALADDVEADQRSDWERSGRKGPEPKIHRMNETPTDNPTGASGEGGWRKYKAKPAGQLRETSEDTQIKAQLTYSGWKLEGKKKETDENGTFTRYIYNKDGNELGVSEVEDGLVNWYLIDITKPDGMVSGNDPVEEFIENMNDMDSDEFDPLGSVIKRKNFDEDTSYAGGMGQGGNAGQSYRKFTPKSAGTFESTSTEKYEVAVEYGPTASHVEKIVVTASSAAEAQQKALAKFKQSSPGKRGMVGGYRKVSEDQLDEKCWDTHKQVGMKQKGSNTVPNCVPKESVTRKGLKR